MEKDVVNERGFSMRFEQHMKDMESHTLQREKPVGNNPVTRRLKGRTSFNLLPLGLYGISGKQAGNEFSLFSKSEEVKKIKEEYNVTKSKKKSLDCSSEIVSHFKGWIGCAAATCLTLLRSQQHCQ